MVGKPRYRVERTPPEAAYDALTRIWAKNLELESDPASKYAWLYRDAPDPPGLVFMLLSDDAGAIGTAGVGIRRIATGGRELRAGLAGDLAVDRDHRSVMPALTLVREVKAWALGELDLAYGFPNRAAEGVFKRAGYRALGMIGRYVRVLRHAGYVDRIGDAELARIPARLRPVATALLASPVGGVLARGVDLAQLARGGAGLVRAARDLRLEWLTGGDPRLDALWASARDDHEVVGARTARFVDWRFFRGAGAGARSLVLAVDRRGAPQAYAVVEQPADVASIRDLFGHRAAIPSLIDRLAPALYRRGAASISFRYLGARWLAGVLTARGYVLRQADRMIGIAVSERVEAALAARLLDPESWHITDADEDV